MARAVLSMLFGSEMVRPSSFVSASSISRLALGTSPPASSSISRSGAYQSAPAAFCCVAVRGAGTGRPVREAKWSAISLRFWFCRACSDGGLGGFWACSGFGVLRSGCAGGDALGARAGQGAA